MKKIYKYMASIQENVYIDKLANRGNKYNNTYHSTIEMKPVDIRSRTYIDFNNKDPKFSDHVKHFQKKLSFELD